MSKLVARTRPGLNMGSPNPTRARKKVARPSPTLSADLHFLVRSGAPLSVLSLPLFRKIKRGLRICKVKLGSETINSAISYVARFSLSLILSLFILIMLSALQLIMHILL